MVATVTMPTETQVAIVGGGPVGLCLACLLSLRGVDCVVLEKRTGEREHSRAIGIHPPALHVLKAAGVADALIRRGVCIGGGLVYLDKTRIGRVPLAGVDSVYPFVLSVPQTVTEAALTARLYELAPDALVRGVSVAATETRDGATYLRIAGVHGGESCLRARHVVACDGKNSGLRTAARIPFRGGKYPDSYLMGDFADNTAFGTDAALFVTRGGIVESFPLPGQMRRWVARLPERMETRDAHDLAAIVAERTGFSVPVETCAWMSPFGIEYGLAETLSRGNLTLMGDAAHIVSPIGGQGMNLGFLDAENYAAPVPRMGLENAMRGLFTPNSHSKRQRSIAKIALRRAELNTKLGRPCPAWHPHRALVWGIAHVPALRAHFARAFTMGGLGKDDVPRFLREQ